MRTFLKILITFCIYIITLSSNAFCEEFSSINNHQNDTISAISHNKIDLLSAKENETITQNTSRNENLTINNNSNNSDNGFSNCFFFYNSQFRKILDYLYTLSFLEIKSKINFSLIFTEIFPNAP